MLPNTKLPINENEKIKQQQQQLHINDLEETPIKTQTPQNSSYNSTPKTSGLKPPSVKPKIPVTPPLSSSSNSPLSSSSNNNNSKNNSTGNNSNNTNNNNIGMATTTTTTTSTNINTTPQNSTPIKNRSTISSTPSSNTPKFNEYNNTVNSAKKNQSQGGLVLEEVPSESEYEMDPNVSQFSDSPLTPKRSTNIFKTPRRWRLVPANCTCLVHDPNLNNSNNIASKINNSNNTNSSNINYCPNCSQANIDQEQQHNHHHHQQQHNHQENNSFENSYEYNRVTSSTPNNRQNGNSSHFSTPLKKVDYKVVPTGDFEKELDLLKNEVSDLEDEFNILKSSKKSEYSNSFGPTSRFTTNITTSTHSSQKSPYTSQYSNNSSTYTPTKSNYSTVPPPSQQQHYQTQPPPATTTTTATTAATTTATTTNNIDSASDKLYEQLNSFQKKMEFEIDQLNKDDNSNSNSNNNSNIPLKIYMNDKSVINTPFTSIPHHNNSHNNNSSKSTLIEQIVNLLDDLEKEKNQTRMLLKERNEFESLLKELKRLLDLKDGDINNLKLLNLNIEKELRDKNEINSKLMEQLKQYQQELLEKAVDLSTLKELEIEINSMKHQYSQRVLEFDEKTDLIKRGEQEIQQLQNNIQQMKLEINNQEKAESLLNQIVKLKNDYHILETTSKSHLENEKSKYKLLKDQYDLEKYDYKQQIANLNQLEFEMKKSINELSLNNSKLELQLSNKQKEIDQFEFERKGKLLVDKVEWDNLNREYKQLKEHNNSTNQKLNQVVFENQKLLDQNQKLSDLKANNEKLINEMQVDIENLLLSKQTLEDYINTLLKENSDMKERLSRVHNIVQDSPRKQFPMFNFNQLSPKSPFLKTKINNSNNNSNNLNFNGYTKSYIYSKSIDPNNLMESDINNNSFIKNLNFNDSQHNENHNSNNTQQHQEEEKEGEDQNNNQQYFDEYYDDDNGEYIQQQQQEEKEQGEDEYYEEVEEQEEGDYEQHQEQQFNHLNGHGNEGEEYSNQNSINGSFTNNSDSNLNGFVGSTFEDL